MLKLSLVAFEAKLKLGVFTDCYNQQLRCQHLRQSLQAIRFYQMSQMRSNSTLGALLFH